MSGAASHATALALLDRFGTLDQGDATAIALPGVLVELLDELARPRRPVCCGVCGCLCRPAELCPSCGHPAPQWNPERKASPCT